MIAERPGCRVVADGRAVVVRDRQVFAWSRFSAAQRAVAELAAQGWTVSEIARELHWSPANVARVLGVLRWSLGVVDRRPIGPVLARLAQTEGVA